jgi:pimeloyl-ACP methyl ester carboxylesterase
VKAVLIPGPLGVVRLHDLPGRGVPLVFVHGLGCASSCDYPAVVRDTALAGRRAVLIDLLGSGFSDRPRAFDYSIPSHARVVVEVILALDLPTLDLFGHSMGGAVAIEAGGMLVSRVKRLVLSEPNLDAGGGIVSRVVAAQTEDEYVADGHARAIREATASGNHIWAGSMAVTAPFAVHRAAVSLVAGGSPSWRRRLLGHPVHRTVIFGARSLPDPDTEALPPSGVDIAVVPEAGHSMAWENPAGLAAAIARACSRPPAA